MEYELIISEVSPSSSKIVALMGYAQVPHRIRVQNVLTSNGRRRRLAGEEVVPVLRRGEWVVSGAREIARYIMERTGEPLLPRGAGSLLAFFLEDFADEWVTRWMMQFRWGHPEDAERATERLGQELLGGLQVGARALGEPVAALRRRRMRACGVRPENDVVLRVSAARCLDSLERILSSGPPYLFAGYPTVADFAFFGPLSQFQSDPTGRQILRRFPAVRAYVHRLEGARERPATVELREVGPRDLGELQPLFGELMGSYWPMLASNYRAQAAGGVGDEVRAPLLDGGLFLFESSVGLRERLEELMGLIDERYARQDVLFGQQGMRMERALVRQIAELCKSEAGRQLLRGFRHVGLH